LLWEHERFERSFEELAVRVERLRTVDRGRDRQALGHLWRLVAETLVEHLDEERGYRDAAVRSVEDI
jgi:hypothetical protein